MLGKFIGQRLRSSVSGLAYPRPHAARGSQEFQDSRVVKFTRSAAAAALQPTRPAQMQDPKTWSAWNLIADRPVPVAENTRKTQAQTKS